MFKTGFNRYALEGDTISCEVDGYTVTARLFRDDCGDAPDERDDGFWPSLDPKEAGWIGSNSRTELERQRTKAREVMKAWKANEWFYVGISVTVEREGVCLVGEYGHALWGVDCNYPGSDNSYLCEVANELLPEALSEAKRKCRSLSSAVREEA
jgi:hypothetical protein